MKPSIIALWVGIALLSAGALDSARTEARLRLLGNRSRVPQASAKAGSQPSSEQDRVPDSMPGGLIQVAYAAQVGQPVRGVSDGKATGVPRRRGTARAVAHASCALDAAGGPLPIVGPRDPVGPDVPLSAAESSALSRSVTVEGRTASAVQAACNRAAYKNIPVVLLPAGLYLFETMVRVPGGLTLLGEGSKTVCQTVGDYRVLFQVEGSPIRFTRLKLQGATTAWSTTNRTWGVYGEGNQTRVDHCELLGFSHAVIFTKEADLQVDHCSIHHNLRAGLGYGVNVEEGTHAVISDNDFSQCRHMLASGGAIYYDFRVTGKQYVHVPGVRKTHWEFLYNHCHDDSEALNPQSAVDAHPGMDGTFVMEGNLVENVNLGVDIFDGSGLIRNNVFRNLNRAIRIENLGQHDGIPVQGAMPHDIAVSGTTFIGVQLPYAIGVSRNVTIDGVLWSGQ